MAEWQYKSMFDEEYDEMCKYSGPCSNCNETCTIEDGDVIGAVFCRDCELEIMEKNKGNKMEEQIKIENGISNLASALCKAQGVMGGAKKDKKNDFFKSSYADLSSVFDAIREPLSSNGLAVSQILDVLEGGITVLITRLMHVSGEFIDSKIVVPIDPNPQRVGSALTYFRRYSLMSICGIPAEDDDGNSASGKGLNDTQISMLNEMIRGHDDIREAIVESCGNGFCKIRADKYEKAKAWISSLISSKIEVDNG